MRAPLAAIRHQTRERCGQWIVDAARNLMRTRGASAAGRIDVSMLDPRESTNSLPLAVPSVEDAPPDVTSDSLDSFDEAPTVEDLPSKPRLLRWPGFSRPRGRIVLSLSRVRIIASGLVLLVLLALIGVAIQSRVPVVQYAKAKTGTLTVHFATTGVLQSATYAANFAGSGIIAKINVTVGQQVNTGDPLATLDTTQLQDAVNQENAAVAAAHTKVTDAQNNLAKVQAATSAQVQSAFDAEQSAIDTCKAKGGSGEAACEQRAQDAYAAAQAQADQQNAAAQLTLDDAQAALSSAQAQLQTAQDNLNGATLAAPHAGTIAAINQAVGSTVVGSSATAPVTNFIVIADLNALQIHASVPVTNVTGVQSGTLVRFTVPSAGSTQFTGEVDGVSPNGTLINNVLMYPLTINVEMQSVQTGNAHLYPGMTAAVNVIVVEKPGVTLIPASAVVFAQAAGKAKEGGFLTSKQVATAMQQARDLVVEAEDAGNVDPADPPQASYVLQNTNGKWVLVPVLLGLTDGTSYEVLGGLTLGEKIVSGEKNSTVTVPTPTPAISQ